MSINCATGVGPLLNFDEWTMEYFLGWGENSYFMMALEFLSCLQTALLSANYDNILVVCSHIVCIKALKKFQVRVAGCHKFLPPRQEKINFSRGKYFCSVSSYAFFYISLHLCCHCTTTT